MNAHNVIYLRFIYFVKNTNCQRQIIYCHLLSISVFFLAAPSAMRNHAAAVTDRQDIFTRQQPAETAVTLTMPDFPC